ncbi:MAG: 2,3-bisphosphoglycerate-independent phosphoglycerate mutase, partial [Bdellovibrionales bacterium]|nr:2,3-bisphosphoglycerate-independent phosphoglycerate mutase [Bdellovibrionales bacterium]
GFGINPNTNKNAIRDAKKPNLDSLFNDYPYTTISACGTAVGLPDGVMGNSEVGHLNLGAGKPVRQDLIRINEAIENNSLKNMGQLQKLISFAQNHTKRIHMMGLLSDGAVHSHIDHIKALIDIFSEHKDLKLFFHALMDGRDTPVDHGIKYLQELGPFKDKFQFASMQGRSIGMDRDRRWEKIEHCYKTITGQGDVTNLSPQEYLKGQYESNIYDEFITPVLFDKEFAIQPGDAFFFINFRPDRAIQISLCLNDPHFSEFEVPIRPEFYLCMTPYIDDEVKLPILFDKERIKGGLSEYLAEQGIHQFKIAETEKYAHVTYFFNGGEKKPFKGETQVLVPSPREVATYDLKPEMSAHEVTKKLMEALDDDEYRLYVVNYANSDMVGHTGNYEAAKKCIEVLDECVGELIKKCDENSISFLLTADHGNSDQMVHPDGSPHTAHTKAKVPCCLFHPKLKGVKLKSIEGGALKDVAPTLLSMMGVPIPPQFEGIPIFQEE